MIMIDIHKEDFTIPLCFLKIKTGIKYNKILTILTLGSEDVCELLLFVTFFSVVFKFL